MSEIPRKYLIIGGIAVFLIIIITVILLVAGSSGGKKNPQKVELTWWKTFEDTENVSDLISQYQKLNKNVTIKFVKKDISDYEEELVDALAAGKGPDIFTIHNDWLPKHMDKISPMPEKQMNTRAYKETFVDVATDDFVKNGQIYALPMSVDLLVLFYNKDILNSAGIAQPPATWTEVVNAVQKITKQSQPGTFSRSGIAMGTAANINRSVDLLLLLMLQNGTTFYNSEFSSASFADSVTVGGESYKPGERALEYFAQFSNPAKTTYTWNAKTDFSVDSFTQGKLGMMLSYAYMMPAVSDRSPNLNWDVAAAPQIDKSGLKVNFANYWAETVSKSTPNSAVAWDFLKFITQKDALSGYYSKHKLVSSRKDLLNEQISDPEIGVFAENALSARSVYKKDPSAFEGIFAKMIDDVALRSITPSNAIQTAIQQINVNLRR